MGCIVWGCKPSSPSKDTVPVAWNMDDYAWSHRPLLVFADDEDSEALAEQRAVLREAADGLDERHMLVVEVVGKSVKADGLRVATDVDELKKRYGVDLSQPLAVLLIGKDTGVKLRRTRPVAMEEVFGLIDSMPMRRQEMRAASQ